MQPGLPLPLPRFVVGTDARVGADLMKLLVRSEMNEILQAGDAMAQEIEVDAQEIERGDPGSSYAHLLRQMVAGWQETTTRYREED